MLINELSKLVDYKESLEDQIEPIYPLLQLEMGSKIDDEWTTFFGNKKILGNGASGRVYKA